MIQGATPNVTASERLSNCAPKFEVASNNLANNPSNPSKQQEMRTATIAISYFPSIPSRTAVRPAHILIVVKILGRSFKTELMLLLLKIYSCKELKYEYYMQ